MFGLAYVFGRIHESGGLLSGVRFGVLLGVPTVGLASVGIYWTFDIGDRSGALASATLFLRMVAVGAVIGAASRPSRPGAIRPPGGRAPSEAGATGPPCRDGA